MMSFKIPCGGFKSDEKSFSLDLNGVLSVSGGGSGGEPDFYVNVVDASFDEQGVAALTFDVTNEQIYTAYESGKHVFINILGTNAQVQKSPSGFLYAIAFMPEATEGSWITKLGLYYLEAMDPNWRMSITYISATTE